LKITLLSYLDFGDGVTERVDEGEAIDAGVGVKKMILIPPSSGTGESTFLLVRIRETMIMTMRKNPMMMLVAATVLVRSSIR